MRNRSENRYFWTLLLALVVSLAAVQSFAQSGPKTAIPEEARTVALDQPVPVSPKIITGQFANGLRYFIRENNEPRNRAELRLVVKVGSIVEDGDQRGLAHFLEHMAFNGTTNFEKQELVRFMESMGMRLGPGVNASTSFDETIFMLQLPTDSRENVARAFQILEDWAHNLTLDGAEIDKERGVVIEEWRLGQGAGSRIRDKQFPVLLKDSRYAERLPIGTLESLQTFSHDSLRRFYRDWYRPELMGVIAVGDFNGMEVESLVRNHFESLPASPSTARERVGRGVPEHQETLISIVTDKELPQTSVTVYHKMPQVDDWTVAGYRQRMVERLYVGMLNDRFSEIARQSNAPILAAGAGKGRLVGSTGAYSLSAVVPESGVELGIETLFTEAERVARFGFTESELEREKISSMRGIERSYSSRASRNSGSYASEYIRAFLYGESTPDIEYEYELYQRFMPTITLEEVNNVGKPWIQDANTVIAVTGPDKEGVKMPTEGAVLAAMKTADGKDITPYVDTVTDQPLLANAPKAGRITETRSHEGQIVEWKLSNGVRVLLKPTDFQTDQILFRAVSPGGTSLASDENYIPASTAVAVIAGGGLGPFNVTDLQKLMAGKAAVVSPSISMYEEGFSGSASPKDLETLFQLIYMRFTEPRADAQFFEVFNTQNRRVLANRDASPATAFNDAYNRIMTQDHLRQRPVTVETLDKTDLQKSLAFYKDRFADAGDFVFVFVGDLNLDAMRPLVEQYLGGLPSTGRKENWRDVGLRPPKGNIAEVVNKGVEPQSQTRIVFTGTFDYDRQSERTAIQAMAMTVQGRLRNVLREELGGTYSVGVTAGTTFRPEEAYTVIVSFGSSPERYVELIQSIFQEVERLKMSGPTPNEVRDVRETLLRSFETSLRQNSTWVNQLIADDQRDKEPGSSLRTYVDTVNALTPESIQKAVEKYLDTKNVVQVTLLPER